MKLTELINILDRDRDSLIIQVCDKEDWDVYDYLLSSSHIIKQIEDKEIICAEIIAENTIRVDLRW